MIFFLFTQEDDFGRARIYKWVSALQFLIENDVLRVPFQIAHWG